MSNNRNKKYLEKFGKNLRKIRKRTKIAMSELAYKSRMELNSLYRIEKGKVDISICTLRALATALELPPSTLLINIE